MCCLPKLGIGSAFKFGEQALGSRVRIETVWPNGQSLRLQGITGS